jgi:hypothetical protein
MQPVAVTRSLASCIEGCALCNAFCTAAECYRLAPVPPEATADGCGLVIFPRKIYGSWLSLVCARAFCATSEARSSDRFIALCSESWGGCVGCFGCDTAFCDVAGLGMIGGCVARCFCQ